MHGREAGHRGVAGAALVTPDLSRGGQRPERPARCIGTGRRARRHHRVNLFGTVAVIRAALPSLERSHGTVGSTLALRGFSAATTYCASKFAVRGFTHALAAGLAGRVGVTLLIPGGTKTAFFDGRTEQYKPGADAQLNDPAATAGAVLLHPGAASGSRRWPPDRWSAVAAALASDGRRVLVTGGPDEFQLGVVVHEVGDSGGGVREGLAPAAGWKCDQPSRLQEDLPLDESR